MSATAKSWSIAVLALFALAIAALAPAQTFPTSKGDNHRSGQNGNPALYNPGAAVLQWFTPNPATTSWTFTNTSNQAISAGAWNAPFLSGAAPDPFIFDGTGNALADAQEGVNAFAPYVFANAIPCDNQTNNPLLPLAAFAGQLSIFTWTPVKPAIQGNVPNDFALSAWLPAGPTVDNMGNFTYPAEFVVFEIDYGTGLHYVDVVDRNQAGAGFVRLGNGGMPSSVLFHYDGVNPIQVHIYNTIPRDSSGILAGVGPLNNTNSLPPFSYDIYANAVQATLSYGSVVSSPVIGNNLGGTAPLVYAATNLNSNVIQAGHFVTEQHAVLQAFPSFFRGANAPTWTFSPIDQGAVGLTVDRPSAGIVSSPGWSVGNAGTFAGFTGFIGGDFQYETVTNNLATADVVDYGSNVTVPNLLADGSYDVLMWTPGTPAAATFAQTVQVEIDEGAVPTFLTVDLTAINGYQRLGGRRFVNTQANPLVVRVTNYSANPLDAGKLAYADAVRFVGTSNLQINSTPVHVNIPIGITTIVAGMPVYSTQMKSVVITAAEDGRIYCLDAAGRGDGTTDVYWAYPSIPDSTLASWTDPNNSTLPNQPGGYPYANQRDGSKGVTNALMPTGFDLSSALVQEVPVGSGNFFLYITSTNGRVYCIDTAGRGDFNLSTRSPGTTSRVWTFPDDYRPDAPGTPSKPSALGATNASVLYNANVNGPTIFVPTAQGRIYALDALGTIAQSTTTTKWTFPLQKQPTVGPFNATPVLAKPQNSADMMLYAGTERKNGTNVGQFFGIDAETGVSKWFFQGAGSTATDVADDFEGGPCVAFGNQVGDLAHPDYLFVANQNGYVYALDPDNNGALIWETNELQSGVSAPLSFTYLNVFGNVINTVLNGTPTVMVPTDSGSFFGLFANVNNRNVQNGRADYGYQAAGDHIYAGMAQSLTPTAAAPQTYMYGGDDLGFIYGFNAGAPGGVGGVNGGPGEDIGVPNDPDAQDFRDAKAQFYLASSYNDIRTKNLPDYATYTAAGEFLPPRNPEAFDFGEVLYVMVYNFPAGAIPNLNTVTFTVNVEGRTMRQSVIQARQFSGAVPTAPDGFTKEDGYAILAFPLQPSGVNAMAPGDGSISYSIQEAVSPESGNRKIFFNPGAPVIPFFVANPLAIAMKDDVNGFGIVNDSLGAQPAAFGFAGFWENLFNGSEKYAANQTFDPSALLTSTGVVSHGGTGTQTVFAYDRSLMATLTGPEIPSISNIRVDRSNLSWQGGYNSIVKPIGGANGLYKGGLPILEQFEDVPDQFPNISFDYGDILRDHILVTSNPTGASGNPLFSPVALFKPNGLFVKDAAGNETNQPVPQAQWSARTPVPTPIQVDINVPRFQPANLSLGTDTLGNTNISDGYLGLFNVFTDSNGSGHLQLNGGVREAYRSFNLGAGVGVDEHMSVVTPSVDLGSLAQGAGLRVPSGEYAVRSPWVDLGLPLTNRIYKSFTALNDGNVNILDARIAHGYNSLGFNPVGWPFYSTTNDDLAYLDGMFFLYSDLDPAFSLSGSGFGLGGPLPNGENIVQKPRVTDLSGRRLTTNAVNLSNANIPTAGGFAINPSAPVGLDPHVTVTPPIGFPVGSYSQVVRLIEDRNYFNYLNGGNGGVDDYNLSILLGTATTPGESFADPSFTLSFNVRESRLTNNSTINTFPMADPNLTGPQFLDSNIQPTGMRDRTFGNLFVAWSSNRPALANGDIGTSTNYSYRIFTASLAGALPATSPNPNNDASPLNEQAFWTSAAGQWFNSAGAYPVGASSANAAAVNALFGVTGTDHVLGVLPGEEDTVRFGQPSLPATGLVNPFLVPSSAAQDYNHALMAFTGDADIQTSSGRVGTHPLFVATVTPTLNGPSTVSAPIASPNDVDMVKGKPSVVQVGLDQAVILYAGGSGGRSRLYYELYNAGVFTKSQPIDTGVGFDSVSDPFGEARLYQGFNAGTFAANHHVIELAFSAKLRGRANSEIFLTRMPTDGVGAPDSSNSNQELLSFFPPQSQELLELQAERGVYRSIGVSWNTETTVALNAIDIGITTGGAAPTSIIVPGSQRLFDPQSGILTLKTTMGTVYADTFEGTIRFASSVPGTNYQVYANYQPKFLRISQTKTASLSGPNFLWDQRRVGTPNYDNAFNMLDRYWYTGNVHSNLADKTLLNSRFYVMYNRAATGPGQSTRPLMETMRLGVQLNVQIPTLANGDVDFTAFQINGQLGPYQVDPTAGRVYFTAFDEDHAVKITVLGVQQVHVISLIPERNETPITIEQAVNENHVSAFLDPFDLPGAANRRPGLVWLLWNSTRTGTSDVFFETIAPILWPIKQ